MQSLDLHGTKHNAADEKTRKFLNFVELPCEIVTGNSPQMKKIVKLIVEEYGWICYEKDNYNYGALIIIERIWIENPKDTNLSSFCNVLRGKQFALWRLNKRRNKASGNLPQPRIENSQTTLHAGLLCSKPKRIFILLDLGKKRLPKTIYPSLASSKLSFFWLTLTLKSDII